VKSQKFCHFCWIGFQQKWTQLKRNEKISYKHHTRKKSSLVIKFKLLQIIDGVNSKVMATRKEDLGNLIIVFSAEDQDPNLNRN